MSTVAAIKLWGRTIGAVATVEGSDVTAFQYDPEFAMSQIQVAPFMMPLSSEVYRFPSLSRQTFHGLPGLLADSLPDKFGSALIDAWLATQGRPANSFNAVERLCYTGTRGMGALEFAPVLGPRARTSSKIQVDQLVELASMVLSDRSTLAESLDDQEKTDALKSILRVGTSAGGARAKAVVAWNPTTQEVRSGQVPADPGFEHWLLKFDGVTNNRDKELADPLGYGAIEYAYFLMARAAGIEMMDSRLLEENGRRHFMTKRFDRHGSRGKMHMQTLGALQHFDFNMAGAYSYEQALLTVNSLGLSMDSSEQLFRRMIFNVVARNQDDHVKNIAFLMDKSGTWSLAPAYDITYAYNPAGMWTSKHQMTINGKQEDFSTEDFRACGAAASLKRGRAMAITADVVDKVKHWTDFAEDAGVAEQLAEQIKQNHRLDFTS